MLDFVFARRLYVCCYDVSDDAIRSRVASIVKSFSCGGQKSAYECFLTYAEYCLLDRLTKEVLEPNDNLVIQPIMHPKKIKVLGIAVKPVDIQFQYVG